MKIGAFFLSCLLAFTAGHITNYSVIIYCQEVLKSNLLSGLGFGLCFGPPLIFGWIAGVLCDRLPPARLIHGGQALFILGLSVLWTSHHFILEPMDRAPFILMAAFFSGVGWSFVSPARMTVLGQVVRPAQLKLASIVFNLFVMLGFGLGPIIISTLRNIESDSIFTGWSGVFITAASLFLIGSLLLLPIRTRALGQSLESGKKQLLEGLHFSRTNAGVRGLLISAFIGYSIMGPIQVLLPRLAKDVLGLTELSRGTFLGALAPSLIVGGVASMILAKRGSTRPIVFTAICLAGFLFASLGFVTSAPLATFILVGVGISGGIGLSLIVASLQAEVGDQVRGRVMSQYTIISQVVPAASGVAAGLLSHFLSVTSAIIVCGVMIAGAKILRRVILRA